MHFWLVRLPWRPLYARTFTAALCIALLFMTLCQSQAADPGPKRVMILHSFGREFKPWREYANAIRTELDQQSPWTLDVQEHSLMTARSTDPSPEAAFVDYLH